MAVAPQEVPKFDDQSFRVLSLTKKIAFCAIMFPFGATSYLLELHHNYDKSDRVLDLGDRVLRKFGIEVERITGPDTKLTQGGQN